MYQSLLASSVHIASWLKVETPSHLMSNAKEGSCSRHEQKDGVLFIWCQRKILSSLQYRYRGLRIATVVSQWGSEYSEFRVVTERARADGCLVLMTSELDETWNMASTFHIASIVWIESVWFRITVLEVLTSTLQNNSSATVNCVVESLTVYMLFWRNSEGISCTSYA